jgi:hypothetical protein
LNIRNKLLAALTILFIVFSLAIVAPPQVQATDPVMATISGTISLPEEPGDLGETLELRVFAEHESGQRESSASVTFVTGQGSLGYSVDVTVGSTYRICYELSPSALRGNLLNSAYYGFGGAMVRRNDATLIPVEGDVTEVNFILPTGTSVSGTVSFEGTEQPSVALRLSNDDGYYERVNIGSDSNRFNVVFPGSGPHVLFYELDRGQYPGDEYVRRGYYAEPSLVTTFRDQAASIPGGAADIALVIPLGHTISGVISVPAGYEISENGLWLSIHAARDGEAPQHTNVELTPYQAEPPPYTITVLPGLDYRVWYRIQSDEPDLIRESYYAGSGSLGTWEHAAKLDLTEGNVDNIDFTLSTGRTISGLISLPDNETAPEGGLNISVNNGQGARDDIFVAKGETSAVYTLSVAPGHHRIRYDIQSHQSAYLQQGYYGGASTVKDYGQAVQVDTTTSGQSGIDLTLLRGSTVTGTVSLPGGLAAEADIQLWVHNDQGGGTPVTMRAGETSVQYVLPVEPNRSMRIWYSLAEENPPLPYIRQGYYSTNGTVFKSWEATHVTSTSGAVDNINLTLIPGLPITGTIRLPEGLSAPSDGLRVYIDNYDGLSSPVTIPAGLNSAAYRLMVPGSGPYRIGYNISRWDYSGHEYVRRALFNDLGTTTFWQNATYVQGGATNVDMAIIAGRTISGTISLPSDFQVPDGGFGFSLNAGRDYEQSQSYNGYFSPDNTDPIGYVITVPEGDGYRVYYNLHRSDTGLVNQAYYGGQGVMVGQQQAAPLDLSSGNLPGINVAMVTGRTISGQVSLPNGDLAPPGGLDIRISDHYGGGMNAIIEEGQTSANYSMVVVPGEYKLRYYINTQQSTYVASGYYGVEGTVSNQDDADIVDVTQSDKNDINITVMRALTISGTVSLPEGRLAATNMQVRVNTNRSSVGVIIPAGQKSVLYELAVEPGSSHEISYSLNESDFTGFVRRAYYSQSGSTTTFWDERGMVAGGTTGVNLELIPGRTISGTVSLPQGYTPPSQGVRVQVYAARNNEMGHYQDVTLTASNHTLPFVLTVPEGTGFMVSYWLNAPGLVSNSHYVAPGVVGSWDQAARLDVVDNDVTGIDMTLITGKTVSGRVSLPDGDVAPYGGLHIGVTNNAGGWTNVTIPAGQTGADYSMVVAVGSFRMQYYINTTQSTYLRHGYYAGEHTVSSYGEAVLVHADPDDTEDLIDINFTLIRAVHVQGVVSLPAGPIDHSLRIRVGTNQGTTIEVNIPAGQTQASYLLPVQPNSSHIISYQIEGSSGNFVRTGFYSSTGTVLEYESATELIVNTTGLSNIDLTLMTGLSVSGTISLPQGRVAPSGGLRIHIGEGYVTTWVTIPANANSTPYTLVVPEGPHRIGYWLPDWEYRGTEYVRRGYYTTSGTTSSWSDALELVVVDNVDNINMTVIMGYTISGMVRLPDGLVAPAGGLPVHIGNNGGAWSSIIIPTGQQSAPYALTVEPGHHMVTYGLYDSQGMAGLITYGYYGGSTYHEAQFVDVTAGSVANIDLQIARGVTISGTVSLPPGITLNSRMRVQISNDEGSWTSVTLPAGSTSAHYTLAVPPGVMQRVRYHISTYDYAGEEFVRDGYYNYPSGTTSNYRDATMIVPNEDTQNVNLTILLPQLRGIVYTPDGSTARNGWIQVQTAEGRYVANTSYSHTGSFSLGGLADNSYRLRAYPGSSTEMAPSQYVDFNIPYLRTEPLQVTLSGVQFTVVAEQAPHGWVEILREEVSGFRWYAGVGLNGMGRAAVGGLSDGSYQLRVYPNGSGALSASSPVLFTVENGNTSFVEIQVELQLPQIYGVLLTPEGNPAAGGWVQLLDANGRHIMGVGVDGNGHFALAGLDVGELYKLRGSPNWRTNYTPSSLVEVTTETLSSAQERLVITLTSPQISGTVYGPDGVVTRGWVEVRGENNTWITSVGIDPMGVYRIGGLNVGTYVIQAMAPGDVSSYTNSEPITIMIGNDSTTQPLTMLSVALTGQVIIPSHVHPSSVWVEVGDADSNWLYTFTVDSQGYFKLPELDFSGEKTYTIQAFAAGGYASLPEEIDAETENITLTLAVQE